ncbi:GpE family phage tail protein [Roseomonas sp. SG15]|uniref:GpE family phage tail protein n=1 Tax=Roseomonas indoligenes TaxID=2820811 RepID=A0A940MX93_9PROT|nr:GpE family phage tail protein [Pararoseomonas indoligenes]
MLFHWPPSEIDRLTPSDLSRWLGAANRLLQQQRRP